MKEHTVLIVDDEKRIGNALIRTIKQRIKAQCVFVESAEAAIGIIKSCEQPFSLIISDERMPGMTGSAFLEKAKELTPDTVRFLITGYADIKAVTDAVNRGSVHRFITKPWDSHILMEMIKSAFGYHELLLENRRLFTLAKKQTARLFAFNKELKKKAEIYKEKIISRDRQILKLKEQIKSGHPHKNDTDEIEQLLTKNHMLTEERLPNCCQAITAELYSQFESLARRNGFLLP